MALFLIVGEEPSTIPKILEIIKSVDGLRSIHYNWEKVAASLGVRKTELPSIIRNVESLWLELLHTWKEMSGEFATLGALCTAISFDDTKRITDKLFDEFAKILNDQIFDEDGVYLDGNFIMMRNIFVSPPCITTQPKKNDPMLLLRHSLKIPNNLISRDWMGRIFEQFIKKLNDEQLEKVERYSLMKLSLHSFARTMDLKEIEYEDEARQRISKMNLRNYGMSFFYWFIVAKSVIKVMMEDEGRIWLLLDKVFEIEDEYAEDDNLAYKFKYSVLVFFIDWLMGLEKEDGSKLYDVPFNVEDPSMVKYAIGFVKCNAVNLTKHIFGYHSLLHKIVQNTMWLGHTELETRKTTVLKLLNANPISVHIRDERNSPVLRKRYVHVQILKILIERGANVEEVDRRRRNFVHQLTRYYPSEQFYELVHYLMERNQIQLLNARDVDQQTPLIIAPQLVLSVYNVNAISLLASFGVDLNVNDKYGQGFMYYAVKWNKSVCVLQALIQCGANWRWRGNDNASLLHVAAEEGNLGAMKYLVGLGLDVNARDENANTPIDLAITSYAPDRDEVIKFLLRQW